MMIVSYSVKKREIRMVFDNDGIFWREIFGERKLFNWLGEPSWHFVSWQWESLQVVCMVKKAGISIHEQIRGR